MNNKRAGHLSLIESLISEPQKKLKSDNQNQKSNQKEQSLLQLLYKDDVPIISNQSNSENEQKKIQNQGDQNVVYIQDDQEIKNENNQKRQPPKDPRLPKTQQQQAQISESGNDSINVENQSAEIPNKYTGSHLPIYKFKKLIIDSVNQHRVTIISGDTGCGKSTQVPKYIVESNQIEIEQHQLFSPIKNDDEIEEETFTNQQKKTKSKQDPPRKAKIICTQPRRIAAINLAKRVSEELKDNRLGERVGYQIGFDSLQSSDTEILFVTTGIFLQRLIHEKEAFLNIYTHIILDEVHERDIDSDFCMISLKHYLALHLPVKLILMSATINPDLFAKYFSDKQLDNLSQELMDLNFYSDPSRFFNLHCKKNYDWTIQNNIDMKKEKKEEVDEQGDCSLVQGQIKSGTTQNNAVKIESGITQQDQQITEQQLDQFNQKTQKQQHNQQLIDSQIKILQQQTKQRYIKPQIVKSDMKSNLPQIIPEKQLKQEFIDGDKKTNNEQMQIKTNKSTESIDQQQSQIVDRIDRAAHVNIAQKPLYKVHQQFLEETLAMLNNVSKLDGNMQNQFSIDKPELIPNVVEIGAQLIQYILTENIGNDQGSILIFLPGFHEINTMTELLHQIMDPQAIQHIQIIELHSTMSDSNSHKLFMQKMNKRKVIIATNVAESSITIPDCVYVIDFCLTKEMKYNTRTSTEKLELCWASQASCRQRMGRVGRVADGWAFRMIPQIIFNQLQAFQTPEILRCPLEKLILRIKLLDTMSLEENENIQNIQSTIIKKEEEIMNNIKRLEENENCLNNNMNLQANFETFISQADTRKQLEQTLSLKKKVILSRIFNDPSIILNRAIEPPQIENIGRAMRHLQEVGGLEYVYIINQKTKEKFDISDIKITDMGRFFCDMPCEIRVSKFICLGQIFGCLLDTLTIGSIISQRRPFFVPQNRRRFYPTIGNSNNNNRQDNLSSTNLFVKNIFHYDECNESDQIMMLQMFKDWEQKFYFQWVQSNFDLPLVSNQDNASKQNGQNQKDLYHKPALRKFSRMYITEYENQWCSDLCIDPFNMREILLEREELKLRVIELTTTKLQYLDLVNNDNILRLKFCIIGAFISTMIQAKPIRSKTVDNEKTTLISKGHDPKKVLIINSCDVYKFCDYQYQQMESLTENIKKAIEEYCRPFPNVKIQKISYNIENMYIEFQNSDFYTLQAIKKLFCEKQFFKDYIARANSRLRYYQLSNQQQYQNQQLTQLQPIKKLEADQPIDIYSQIINTGTQFYFIYQSNFGCINTNKFMSVEIERDSINSITFNLDEEPKYIVAYDIVEKQSKFQAFCTTLLPTDKYPLFAAIAGLIFGCNVQLRSDVEGKYYQEILVDSVLLELNHYLFDKDIDEINKYRKIIKTNLDGENFFKELSYDLWKDIFSNLVSKIRSKIVQKDKWEGVYSTYLQNMQNVLGSNYLTCQEDDIDVEKSQQGSASNKARPVLLPKQNNIMARRPFYLAKRRITLEDKKEFENQHGFMAPIIKTKKSKEDFVDIYSKEKFANLQNYLIGYKEWKNDVLKRINNNYNMIVVRQAQLCCGLCWQEYKDIHLLFKVTRLEELDKTKLPKSEITLPFYINKQIKQITYDFYQDCIYVQKVNQPTKENPFVAQIEFKSIIDILGMKNDINAYDYYGCKKYSHIIGFSEKKPEFCSQNLIYIPYFSKLRIVYPGLENEQLDFRLFNQDTIATKQQSQLDKYNSQQFENKLFQCQACLITDNVEDYDKNRYNHPQTDQHYQTTQRLEFKSHIESKQHNDIIRQFILSLDNKPNQPVNLN